MTTDHQGSVRAERMDRVEFWKSIFWAFAGLGAVASVIIDSTPGAIVACYAIWMFR